MPSNKRHGCPQIQSPETIRYKTSVQKLYQGEQEQHSAVEDTTSDHWNLSLSSGEQLFAWSQIWCWTHSIANWLKHSCLRPWVFHSIVQRHRPYLIRFWKDYELLKEFIQHHFKLKKKRVEDTWAMCGECEEKETFHIIINMRPCTITRQHHSVSCESCKICLREENMPLC